MIKQISWGDYWTLLGVLCAFYYAIIILLFYRKELSELISGKRKLVAAKSVITAPPTSPPHPAGQAAPAGRAEVTEEEKLFALTNVLMQELVPVFGNEYVKGELVT